MLLVSDAVETLGEDMDSEASSETVVSEVQERSGGRGQFSSGHSDPVL